MDNRTTLLPYQREGVRRIEVFDGRSLVAMDPGLGKTITALSYLARNPETCPAVVVCPASVKYVWEKQAMEHARRRVIICDSTSPPDPSDVSLSGGQIYVVNYDILYAWVPFLLAQGIQTAIFDECQKLGNRTTRQTKAARKLAGSLPYVLGLSGTPLMNRPSELWPMLNILRPDLYPSFTAFAFEFCDPKRKPWGWEYKGATNLDKLHENLTQQLMIRYRKSDVLKDLPAKVREIIPCVLPPAAKAEYDKANGDFLVWLRQHNPAKFDSASRAVALTRGNYLLQLAAKLKLRTVVDWANDFLRETDEKLVLFGYHKKMIEALQRRVEAKSVIVDGSVVGRDRAIAVDQFQKDSRTRLYIGNLQAGGVGTTLTAGSTVGMTQLYWRPGDLIQAEDRLHRIGQEGTVFCYYFIAMGTIEETLCKVLEQKQGTISAVLDGGPMMDDLNVFTMVMESLLKAE